MNNDDVAFGSLSEERFIMRDLVKVLKKENHLHFLARANREIEMTNVCNFFNMDVPDLLEIILENDLVMFIRKGSECKNLAFFTTVDPFNRSGTQILKHVKVASSQPI